MKLTRYRVQNFKSVKDSGWIDCEDVTTLVGINEAGKSNLLLALWKLNPVIGGEIDLLHDAPVSRLTEIRKNTNSVQFIEAEFSISSEEKENIHEKLTYQISDLDTVLVTRFYDGHFEFQYPNGIPVMGKSSDFRNSTEEHPEIIEGEGNPAEKESGSELTPPIFDIVELEKILKDMMPKFVYYSNYGNLSTRLYLPHVTKWLKNETVEGLSRNEEQIRTLRVLFNFVGLQPDEIKELGLDPKDLVAARYGYNSRSTYTPTAEEIKKAQQAKEERTILLQSAAAKLTREFACWWNQGAYKFRFDADGDYFTIWVSDEKRPDEVGLELRSTGLQWFLSFFLVFLVESKETHHDAVLLLDEAGLTLHPKAQKDLCQFFNNLAKENQVIHTTHSPFIVDTNNIDRCKVVFVDSDGFTVASSNLRENADKLNEQSIYAVHAAMGLSVSDILFQGCKQVIVEGQSDQIYLSAIKQALIAAQKIAPKEEYLFLPSGGIKGIPGIVSLLGGKQGQLPKVLVDSDKSGQDAKKRLLSGLYQSDKDSIFEIKDFTSRDGSEVEDLIPYTYLKNGINKLFVNIDSDEDQFEDIYDKAFPILPQIESFASKHSIYLPQGWKVELAKSAKARILKSKELEIPESWENLFNKLIAK